MDGGTHLWTQTTACWRGARTIKEVLYRISDTVTQHGLIRPRWQIYRPKTHQSTSRSRTLFASPGQHRDRLR